MRTRPLGASGIEASVVALGAWAIGGWNWGGADDDKSVAAIHAAIDHGVTFIDTAPVYGMGRSEEVVGRALHGSRRQQVVLASKCSLSWDDAPGGVFHLAADDHGKLDKNDPAVKYRIRRDARPKSLRKGVEDSLRRLRTDVIDLMQTHWQDPSTPIEDTMTELLRLQKEGKIRAIGCSNATPDDMERYRSIGRLDADQEKYNMLDRDREQDNLPYCAERRIAFLAYSPLAQGLLTGAIGPERVFAPGDGRADTPRFSVENRLRVRNFLRDIQPVADDYRLTPGQLVTAWTLAQPGCTHVLLGARTAKQAAENAKGGDILLDDAAVAVVREKVEKHLH